MSDTPETDELILSKNGFGATDYEWREYSRRLERERDEARKEIDDIRKMLSESGEAIGNGVHDFSIIEMVENIIQSKNYFIKKSDSAEWERDEAREENAKLLDIAERLSICAEDLEKYTWHCNDQGCDCGRCKLAIEQKKLRAELEQLKEGAK